MAIWRVCEALAQWGQPNGVRRLRREDDEADGWEDIVEEFEQDGGWHSRRIQVKAHRELLPRKAFVPLLEALGDGRSRLLVLRDSSVNVEGIGQASRLHDLTERAREADAGRAVQAAGAGTRTVLENIGLALRDDSATATLHRLSDLHVEFTGSEQQLEGNTKRLLGTQFADPDVALDRIAARVRATARHAETLDIHDLRRDLSDLRPPNIAIPPGLEARRRAYLEGLVSDIDARSPLGEAYTTAFALRDVMVDRSVAGEDDVARPLGVHLADAIARGTKRIALSGAVGVGKSVELARLARNLAEPARRNPGAPIPLLLAARDHRALVGPDALAKAILDSGAKKVILLDAMDEAQPTDTTFLSIDNLCRREDVLCVLAAGRPGSTPAGWPVLRLENWTPSTREWFLARWSALDNEAVESFRELSCIEDVASTPLLATYALLVARNQPEALASRTKLFDALITKVFVHWVAKGGSIDERQRAADHWSSFEPLFARLSWESMTTGSLEGSRIRALLRERLGAAHADIALERSRRQLGLLIEAGDEYRFASRPIADHLAGAYLAKHPNLARPVSPLARWREPLLQSASILVAAGTPEPVIEWIRSLLPTESRPLQVGRTIRRVSLAAELAVELDEGADLLAEDLAEALCIHLTEECSIWAGDEAAEVCRTIAAHGGPVWRQLQPMIHTRLASRVHNPARWYLAQEGTQELWLSALFHRDPGTRGEAIRRLLGHSSPDPDSTLFLLGTANDAGVAGFLPSPMHVGASLLARHLEENPAPELVLLLRQWLHCGFQRREILAAIALPKGIEDLRRAEILTSVRTVYGPVRDALLRLEGAYEHLDEKWPGWRDQTDSYTLSPLEQPGPLPPPSKVARHRMLRVLGTEERFGRELLGTGKPLDYEETETLCGLALSHPTLASELLNRRGERPPGLYSVRAMELLAPAVAMHPSVRDALIHMVRELEGNWAHSCPGAALERIAHTDEEAREAYAAWLPRSGGRGAWGWEPDLAVWSLPGVKEIVADQARRAWQQTTTGDFIPFNATSDIAAWWPAGASEEIAEGLLVWYDSSDPQFVINAIALLSSAPLSGAHAARFWDLLETRVASLPVGTVSFDLIRATEALARSTGSPETREAALWQLWARGTRSVKLLASSGLVRTLDAWDSAALAGLASNWWPCQLFTLRNLAPILGPLVQANPDAWAQTARGLLDAGNVADVATVAIHLPSALLTALLSRLPPTAHWPLWAETGRTMRHARPLDLLEMLAWQAGLDSLPMDDGAKDSPELG